MLSDAVIFVAAELDLRLCGNTERKDLTLSKTLLPNFSYEVREQFLSF